MNGDERERPDRGQRPAPDPAFKAQLRDELDQSARAPAWRPHRPLLLALAYFGSGTVLLAVAFGLA